MLSGEGSYASLTSQFPHVDFSAANLIKEFRDGITAVVNGLHGSLGPYWNAAKTMLALKGEKMNGKLFTRFNAGKSVMLRPHAVLR